ncbi:aminotransferase class I/II-fold pyridoxal phosphate-dependent enzyme [Escherichia coli]
MDPKSGPSSPLVRRGAGTPDVGDAGSGDTVLVPNPDYPIDFYGAVIAGLRYAQCRWWKVSISSTNWSAPFVKVIRKPKMVILGFPSNPTAQCVELESSKRLWHWRNATMCWSSMTAYADIVYDGWRAPSIVQVPGARDVAVEFFTLSKSSTWRAGVGFIVGNKTLVSALARIKSYHDYGTFTPCRWRRSGTRGRSTVVRDIAEQCKRRRDVLVKGLHEAGWMVEIPKASMYVWAKMPEPTLPWARSNSQKAA